MIRAEQVLEKLSEADAMPAGRQTFVFTDGGSGVGVKIEFERLEALAAQIWEVETVPGQPPKAALTDRAKAIAGRVTGLLEPLKLLEADLAAGRALLRSATPAAQDADRRYYEALIESGGRAVLRRYQGSVAVPGRQQVSFALTREALAKLVSDLSA